MDKRKHRHRIGDEAVAAFPGARRLSGGRGVEDPHRACSGREVLPRAVEGEDEGGGGGHSPACCPSVLLAGEDVSGVGDDGFVPDDEACLAREGAGQLDDLLLAAVVDGAVVPGFVGARAREDRREGFAGALGVGGDGDAECADLAGEGRPEARGLVSPGIGERAGTVGIVVGGLRVANEDEGWHTSKRNRMGRNSWLWESKALRASARRANA